MHELFEQVLGQRDLSKAGDLFSLEDKDIEEDLTVVLQKIQEIANSSEYRKSNNDQSVVEICINRVTSAIRENGSIKSHASALVKLLDSCLRHNLKPTTKEEDPPHAKIASDILSCLFLNYSKKDVMEQSLPIAVRFLQQGNRELSRNTSSYLSLAAIDNAKLLGDQIYTILDSIVYHKNKQLARVLLQIYSENKDPIHDQMAQLVQLLPECDLSEKQSLLQLFGLVAKERPRLLESFILLLCHHLTSASTAPMVLQIFLDMASVNPEPFAYHVTQLKQTAEALPAMLCLTAQVLGFVGKMDKNHAKDIVTWLVGQLPTADNHTLPIVLKEIKAVSEGFPNVLPEHIPEIAKCSQSGSVATQLVLQQLKEISSKSAILPERKTVASQTEGIVTVIKIGEEPHSHNESSDHVTVLTPSSLANLHQSKNASTSTREISFPQSTSVTPLIAGPGVTLVSPKGGSSVMTSYAPITAHHYIVPMTSRQSSLTQSLTLSQTLAERPAHVPPTGHVTSVATITRTTVAGSKAHMDDRKPMPTVSTTTTPTYVGQCQPIPYRDAVKQFCEKHLDKIKAYMETSCGQMPLPIKATLEESKHKRYCWLHFICSGQNENCLYSNSFFPIRTRNAKTWIHLMFLAIQARAQKAVSRDDPSVGNLKALWDSLKMNAGNSFVRLVTSSFPSPKDLELVMAELHSLRYFDVFEYVAERFCWACFLCSHPEKAMGLLQDGLPAIEGQLKEKKGKWKAFRRWKTRYFTLSGAQITYSKKDSKQETLPVSKIRSVKALRKGQRDIPKVFEIFTNDQQTYVLKAKDSQHAEQWVQCLQIAVARTHKPSDPAAKRTPDTVDFRHWSPHPHPNLHSPPPTAPKLSRGDSIECGGGGSSTNGKSKDNHTKL